MIGYDLVRGGPKLSLTHFWPKSTRRGFDDLCLISWVACRALKLWFSVFQKHTLLHWSLIVRCQQNRTELGTFCVTWSESSLKIWSDPNVVMIWTLILWSALKAMFMRPQTPFNTRAESYRCVSWQRSSMAPDSRMGSLEGENSSKRLHRVEEATTRKSTKAAR